MHYPPESVNDLVEKSLSTHFEVLVKREKRSFLLIDFGDLLWKSLEDTLMNTV